MTTISHQQRTGTRPLSVGARLTYFLRTPKGMLAALFVPLLAVAGTAVGWPQVLPHVAAALLGAILLDLLITWFDHHTWRWPSSSLLSGLIVAFVLGPEQPLAVTFAVAGLATASKQLIRTHRGHVFNPAALALVVSIPLLATTQSWWGALSDVPWPWLFVLIAGAAYLVDRLNKFPLVLSFLGTAFGLFTMVALVDPTRVAEMFRAPFPQATLFFACFMLTDPPTSPARYEEQLWIGPLVALVSCGVQLLGLGQAYLLIGLLAGNGALVAWRLRNARAAASRTSAAKLPAPGHKRLATG